MSLLNRRGALLQLSRKKVAEDGYLFKKGHSRSKVYGQSDDASTPRRAKYDEEMREERLKNIEEELADITRMLHFKEKRLSQHEAAKNYRLCEQVTEEMMTLKGRRHECEAEKVLLLKKARRAKARQKKKRIICNTSDTSDMPLSSPSPGRSRSITPVHTSLRYPLLGSPESPCGGGPPVMSSSRSLESCAQASTFVTPECPGSRINPVNCESDSNVPLSSPSPGRSRSITPVHTSLRHSLLGSPESPCGGGPPAMSSSRSFESCAQASTFVTPECPGNPVNCERDSNVSDPFSLASEAGSSGTNTSHF